MRTHSIRLLVLAAVLLNACSSAAGAGHNLETERAGEVAQTIQGVLRGGR